MRRLLVRHCGELIGLDPLEQQMLAIAKLTVLRLRGTEPGLLNTRKAKTLV
jgi:hypothetical protein